MLSCNVGDVFGCYEVISEPVVKGEHSFVNVRCLNCNSVYELALSEIKNRPKQSCKKCRGITHKKYEDPQPGEVYNNWKVLNFESYENRFKYFKCECILCGEILSIRKDQLIKSPKKCPGCKVKAANAKREKTKIKRNSPFITKFNSICREAAKRSIPVTITPEFLEELYNKQNKCCALTGDFLPDVRSASLDRIDSSLSYTPENVQFVTKEINLAKHVLSQQQFIDMCNRVVKHANQQASTGLTTSEASETNS